MGRQKGQNGTVSSLLTVSKLRTRSAMKRPIMPKTPPLAPWTVLHPFSNAALKKLPAATSALTFLLLKTVFKHRIHDWLARPERM